jgi:hypothetical protein
MIVGTTAETTGGMTAGRADWVDAGPKPNTHESHLLGFAALDASYGSLNSEVSENDDATTTGGASAICG